MSRMHSKSPNRRLRRHFTDEYKASAVQLVIDEGKTVGAVARDLDLTETALRSWVERALADQNGGKTGLTTTEREELTRLRKEVRVLTEEREILKQAAEAIQVSQVDVVPKILIASQGGKEGGSPMTGNIMEALLTLMMSERLGETAARSRRRGMRRRTPFANGSKAT